LDTSSAGVIESDTISDSFKIEDVGGLYGVEILDTVLISWDPSVNAFSIEVNVREELTLIGVALAEDGDNNFGLPLPVSR
jgi:hypothetical protein